MYCTVDFEADPQPAFAPGDDVFVFAREKPNTGITPPGAVILHFREPLVVDSINRIDYSTGSNPRSDGLLGYVYVILDDNY